MNKAHPIRISLMIFLLIGIFTVGVWAQVVDADRSPGFVSAYQSSGDNAVKIALYKDAGQELKLAAIAELKGRITFNSKGIVGGIDGLRRLQLAEAKDKWLTITKHELINGRAVVTTEDGKAYTIFNLGIGPFAGQIELRTDSTEPPGSTILENEDVVLTLTKRDGREYLRTSFGRPTGMALRSNCVEGAELPLPIRRFRADVEFKATQVKTSTGQELLFAPVNPTVAAESLVIDDLLIKEGALAGTWKYKSVKALGNKGFFVRWARDDGSAVMTFIPWAPVGGMGLSRSQFDAPLCRE